jgi:quinohemoprotein ethanol dehydrogenase
MRRFLFIVFSTALLAAAAVALASASTTAGGKKGVAPEASYLPAGVAPCGSDWPMYACDLAGSAFSPLTQINKSNVANLKMVWQQSFEGPTFTNPVENTPLVVSGAGKNLPLASGTMFAGSSTSVRALDPTTGAVLWTYQGPLVDKANGMTVRPSRSEQSYGNGMVFFAQQDRSIVALNAKTGKPIWDVQLASYGTFGPDSRQIATGMTFFYNDGKDGILFADTNGGDGPLRGFEDAYNAKTGKLLWRFWNTPDPAQLPFILTWGNPANAAFGGVANWSTPAVDPQLGLVYFGLGNVYPETGRAPGKDLWHDSFVAINLKTGKLKWYFQAIHHDEWDYDCPTPPVLFNTRVNGKVARGIALSCKAGYLYVLNRANGGPFPNFPIPEVPVPDLNGGKGAALNNNWPTQPEPTGGAGQLVIHCPTAAQVAAVAPSFPIAPNGTPIVPTCPYASPYNDKYLFWGAGSDYPGMSYDPQTNDLYVCARQVLHGFENKSATDPTQLTISANPPAAGQAGTVSALNMSTNKLDWQVSYQAHPDGRCFSGTFTTASGLLFTASYGDTSDSVANFQAKGVPYGGHIYAYDAKNGKQLWSWQAPDLILAAPITYMVKGKQYVAEYVQGQVTTGKHDLLTVFSL